MRARRSLPVILRPRGEEGIRLRTADATMPGSVLFVGRRCGDEVGGCAEQRLLQRLDALGEGGVLGREGDSIRDTALLHEGLQLSTRLLSRIRPRLLAVDAAKQICRSDDRRVGKA